MARFHTELYLSQAGFNPVNMHGPDLKGKISSFLNEI